MPKHIRRAICTQAPVSVDSWLWQNPTNAHTTSLHSHTGSPESETDRPLSTRVPGFLHYYRHPHGTVQSTEGQDAVRQHMFHDYLCIHGWIPLITRYITLSISGVSEGFWRNYLSTNPASIKMSRFWRCFQRWKSHLTHRSSRSYSFFKQKLVQC